MGLFIQQKDNRSKLQERLDAELREKAKLHMSGAEPLDQTKQSNYIKDTEMANGKSWFWLALALAAVVVIGAAAFVMVTG